MIARFHGGPADGYELALIGGTPSYLMLMESPVADHQARDAMPWVVVGAGFDDHWPGQQRYELSDERPDALAYRYAPTAADADA